MRRWAIGVGIVAALMGVGCGEPCPTEGIPTGSFALSVGSLSFPCPDVSVTETDQGTIALEGDAFVLGVPTRVGTMAYTSPLVLTQEQLCDISEAGTLDIPEADGSTTRYDVLFYVTPGTALVLQDPATGSEVCNISFSAP